jgi:hypothetical protein
MTTFAVLKTRCADELMARSDLTSQISAAILSAISHYQREPFYFTQARTVTFSTVDGQEFYSSSDEDDIATMPGIDTLTATVSSQSKLLVPMTYEWMEENASTSEGAPEYWCYFARQIRFHPIPDQAYTIRAASNPRLTTLSADADTNVWTTEAEELIRNRAKWDVFSNILYDFEKAGMCKANEMDAYNALRSETTRRLGAVKLRTDEAAGMTGGYGAYDINLG